MDFLALVEAARSCRRFDESRPLSLTDLRWLVECARLAPSARNAQQLRFCLVAQGRVCENLFHLTRWAGALKDWNGPGEGERPTGFIAALMPESGGDLLCYDAGIACQTIQLAATSRGWGCCMLQSFERKAATGLLQVREGMKISLLLAVGVAKEKRVVAEMPADGSFSYWRDGAGVHFVPKRPLSELIVSTFAG